MAKLARMAAVCKQLSRAAAQLAAAAGRRPLVAQRLRASRFVKSGIVLLARGTGGGAEPQMRWADANFRMNQDDDRELTRLTETLRSIASHQSEPLQREALEKAALALALVFAAGARTALEQLHADRGAPLSEEQEAHLRRIGLVK